MLRHRLAALIEPRTLVVLADRPMPLAQHIPSALQGSVLIVLAPAGVPLELPSQIPSVAPAERLDQALVCLSSDRLPEALAALRQYRPRSLVLLANDVPGADLVEDLVYCRAWGHMNDCLVLGPRSFGVQRPHRGLNLSHEPQLALEGRVALVAQSRSITSAVLDWARDIQLGFSTVISLGDEAIVEVADVLDYLALDARTDSIVLYLEDLSSSRHFSSALRAAAGTKPVIVLKAGQNPQEPFTIEDVVFNALLRRAGAVRLRYFVQLFSALKVLVYTRRPRGPRIALLSNGAGAAQLALDVMGPSADVNRAELSLAGMKALDELLEPGADVRNPVVTYAPLAAARLRQALQILADDPGVDGVLVLLCPDPLSDLPALARQLASIAPNALKPIVTCLLGDATMRPLRQLLDDVGTPAFRTPESAANAFGILASYHYNQTLAQQTLPPEPLGKPPLLDKARALMRLAHSEGRRTLSDAETRILLECFHIPIQRARSVRTRHEDGDEDSLPMLVRVHRDAKFGPYIVFGSGGQHTPVSARYRAIELPPLNGYLARQLIERSMVWRDALSRSLVPAALEVLQQTLEGISELITELPELESLVIDPLCASGEELWATEIVIEISPEPVLVLPEHSGYRHMTIHPYPRRLVQAKTFKDGTPWQLRPIRPEDAQPLQEFVRDLSNETRYMRFVSMLRELTPRMLARYTRIDYDRELALVATIQVPNPENRGRLREKIIGFAHYLRNADGRGAEYALVIGDDWQRRGLGARLMGGLIEAAKEQRLTYIDGFVLASNRPMLSLMAHLGFQNDADPEDRTMRRVWLDLHDARAA